VNYRVRLTAEASGDLERLYEFLLGRDLQAAERALAAIERGLALLAYSPFSCRKALMELTRFSGHPNVSNGGVQHGSQEYPVYTGV
jgi:plasmid stabilization system protein ParE